jgi:molybdenum cofactor cytidylyltransferase
MDKHNVYGLIISAGLSGRMKKFKPLINYKDKTFLQNITIKLYEVCDKVIIVTGYKSDNIKKSIEQLNYKGRYELVFNPDYEIGMFTSLQAGIRKATEADWILYHFVDQPGLPQSFYSDFIQQVDNNHNWIQPSVDGEKGHPILIHSELFEIVINASNDSNLREVSRDSIIKKKFWECNYREIFQDIDTEEDYLNMD